MTFSLPLPSFLLKLPNIKSKTDEETIKRIISLRQCERFAEFLCCFGICVLLLEDACFNWHSEEIQTREKEENLMDVCQVKWNDSDENGFNKV